MFLNVNGAARDTDNNKLHNEKTPQLTKDQRYDRLIRKRTFQTSWKEKKSLRKGKWLSDMISDNPSDLISLTLSALYLWKSKLNEIYRRSC